MNFVPCSEKIRRTSVVLLLLLAGAVVAVSADQKKAPSAPKPAPHVSAPHKAPAARPSTSRPAAGTHTSPVGGKAGTTSGTRPGVGRPGAGATGRNGRGIAGKGGAVGRTGGNVRHGKGGRQHGERWNWQRFQEYESASSRETGVTQGRRDGEHPTERTDSFHQSQRHAHRARAQWKPPDREHA